MHIYGSALFISPLIQSVFPYALRMMTPMVGRSLLSEHNQISHYMHGQRFICQGPNTNRHRYLTSSLVCESPCLKCGILDSRHCHFHCSSNTFLIRNCTSDIPSTNVTASPVPGPKDFSIWGLLSECFSKYSSKVTSSLQ